MNKELLVPFFLSFTNIKTYFLPYNSQIFQMIILNQCDDNHCATLKQFIITTETRTALPLNFLANVTYLRIKYEIILKLRCNFHLFLFSRGIVRQVGQFVENCSQKSLKSLRKLFTKKKITR